MWYDKYSSPRCRFNAGLATDATEIKLNCNTDYSLSFSGYNDSFKVGLAMLQL